MTNPEALSAAEIDLLTLIAAGHPTSTIAQATGLTAPQVRRRVRMVRQRLDARTDIHAVVIAVRRGLI